MTFDLDWCRVARGKLSSLFRKINQRSKVGSQRFVQEHDFVGEMEAVNGLFPKGATNLISLFLFVSFFGFFLCA